MSGKARSAGRVMRYVGLGLAGLAVLALLVIVLDLRSGESPAGGPGSAAAPSSGAFSGAVIFPIGGGSIHAVNATGTFVKPSAESASVFMVYDRPSPGLAMQIQTGTLTRARDGSWLPVLTDPVVLCDLDEAQAARVRESGIPPGLIEAMLREVTAGPSAPRPRGHGAPVKTVDPHGHF